MRTLALNQDHTLDLRWRTSKPLTIHLGEWTTEVALTVPEGTPCIPATNLPKGGFWLDPAPESIPGDDFTESWIRSVGIHLDASEVEES